MVLSENTGKFILNYLNSSGGFNSGLEFGSGGAGFNRVVILPLLTYQYFIGGNTGLSVPDYIKKLIPWICTNYPHRERHLFIGVG